MDDNDDSLDLNSGTIFFADVDMDGFGDPENEQQACVQPSGYVTNNQDCDDAITGSLTNPDKIEICDGIDNDCDGLIDDQDPSLDLNTGLLFYVDRDADGFGNPASSRRACVQPLGYVTNDQDCDDSDTGAINYPGAAEICDGQYNDCSAVDYAVDGAPIDELDDDGDLYVDCVYAVSTWAGDPSIIGGSDCDDQDERVYLGAPEICDGQYNDCSAVDYAVDSAPLDELDDDGDLYVDCAYDVILWSGPSSILGGMDCNDGDPTVYPSAVEICDGRYNDCSSPDYALDSAPSEELDGDGDLYVSCAYDAATWFGSIAILGGMDCDDEDATSYPEATEICDGVDNNCDTRIDEDVQTTYYLDADSDGFGDPSQTTQACSLPSGYSTANTDCNDGDSAQFPENTELCDGKDNNCDGTIDEGTKITYYLDRDQDGFGDSLASIEACQIVAGYVEKPADCDDFDDQQYPDAIEICNQEDDDCDGFTDEGEDDDAPVGAPTWYVDFDDDGYGSGAATILSCYQPQGYADNADDCADGDPQIHPSAVELCDNLDQNCNDLVDDDPVNGVTFYRDQDGDGDGDKGTTDTVEACYILNSETQEYEPPQGYADIDEDCNDQDQTVSSRRPELCTLDIDENCDGDTTLGAIDPTEWFVDADDDDFGNAQYSILSCPILNLNTGIAGAPSGYADNSDDCNDLDSDLFPGNIEICNGKLDDCDQAEDSDGDGFVEYTARSVEIDHDQDGYIECVFNEDDWVDFATLPIGSGDCQPFDDDVFPGATELCTGEVEDCDSPDYGTTPDNESDDDGDGYVECLGFIGIGWEGDSDVIGGGDCNDSAADENEDGVLDGFHTHPGAAEFYPTPEDPDLQLCLPDNDQDGVPDCVRIPSNTVQPAQSDYECEFGIYLTTEIGPDFVEIPAGEDPVGRYALTHTFYMMTTEVTRGMYEALVGDDPSYFSDNSPPEDYPVENLSWADAAHFANLMSDRQQVERCYDENNNYAPVLAYSSVNFYNCPGFRLPTETEWEYAARSGYPEPVGYYEGAIWTPDGGGLFVNNGASMYVDDDGALPSVSLYAWFGGNNVPDGPKQVARLFRNGFKLYDMVGNVQEMTNDWATIGSTSNFFGREYPVNGSLQNGVLVDPFGSASGTVKVVRGGDYFSYAPDDLGVTKALGILSSSSGERETGFRLVQTKP